MQQSPIFDLYDKGLLSELDFFTQLKDHLKERVTDTQMIFAWNAMLLDFPPHRLQLLNELKSKYRLFLLSNTNETHVTQLETDLYKAHGYKNLEPFFEKVYYSCRVGMRKPDTEIFELVLNQNKLKADETIFIDDSPQHIEGAIKVGIQSYLLPKDKDVKDLIVDLNLF